MKSRPPPGRRTVYAFAKGSAPPTGERKLWHNLCHQPLSHGYAVPAPLTQGSLGGGATPIGEIKLNHDLYRQSLRHGCAVPAPLTQGSLGGGATPIGEIKLNHDLYRQSLRHGCAVPPPFTQGRLLVGAGENYCWSSSSGGCWGFSERTKATMRQKITSRSAKKTVSE